MSHLHDILARSTEKVSVDTRFGPIRGRRADNGAAVFLEVPYALPPARFQDPKSLPPDFRYEDREYITESKYGFQPHNDGQAAGSPFEDKVGLGEPTENPLFVNIVSPPSFPSQTGFPVKVYIHGGFLQFGSPHGLKGQAQFVSAERSEVWVNIGYRLSVFGFLACDEPAVDGNFGFKDQWLALEWIRDNIQAFGGNPADVQLTGLSAGAHSVHQILHRVSHLPDGEKAPFQTAIMQSNAIVTTPKTPAELRPQFLALCHALKLDPARPDILATLRDPARVPAETLTQLIESDALGVEHGTFRGAHTSSWFLSRTDPMAWQKSGGLARGLRAAGVRAVVLGELSEEWYLYAIAHPAAHPPDIERNLRRYYQPDVVARVLALYEPLPADAPQEAVQRRLGEMLSEGQVYLPERLFARDMHEAGFPVVRYQIRWTPEQLRPLGYVTHGTDRALWAFRVPSLQGDQVGVARAWLERIAEATREAVAGDGPVQDVKRVIVLTEGKEIREEEDGEWDRYMRVRVALPGET